ncbi:hypothetical protein L6452_17431 [Arctium lappa]|uniref:Uncharacterized protein n=1 Tax=Arctium lappa TaxID=4217 RepID=A0ACB9C3G4_ARCLA|nr:hypothetical protein L6452_17431 [Arctium lappa]
MIIPSTATCKWINVYDVPDSRLPEINLRPWGSLLKDLEEGNRRTRWINREPYAYWKGNPVVAETRMDLLKSNVSEKEDWNARVFAQFISVFCLSYSIYLIVLSTLDPIRFVAIVFMYSSCSVVVLDVSN